MRDHLLSTVAMSVLTMFVMRPVSPYKVVTIHGLLSDVDYEFRLERE